MTLLHVTGCPQKQGCLAGFIRVVQTNCPKCSRQPDTLQHRTGSDEEGRIRISRRRLKAASDCTSRCYTKDAALLRRLAAIALKHHDPCCLKPVSWRSIISIYDHVAAWPPLKQAIQSQPPYDIEYVCTSGKAMIQKKRNEQDDRRWHDQGGRAATKPRRRRRRHT